MFVNKNKNKSGTVSVRVLEKRGGNNILIKSFGSSKDSAEIEKMVEQPKVFIRHQTGIYYNLFNPPPQLGVDEFVDNISNSQISVAGPEVVFGKLFDNVGYEEIGRLFRPLVLSRLVAPGSKLKTVNYLWRYNGMSYDVSKVYQYLDKLCSRKSKDKSEDKKSDIKDQIE